MINRTIKDYEIKELIATGGMAAIYKALQRPSGQTVAIKILHGHLAQDKDFITRFEREARAAADLKHENIIDILDYGHAEGVYYISMQYVDGKSLKELINSTKFIPHEIALAIVYEICQGIEHAHQKGVVHRDIKPANILVNKEGNVKITDFGLAQAQDLTSITVTGAIVGTPAYMSPEQAAGKRIDIRSDIFSLGVVIYEMVTGTKPFQGDSYSSVIHAILTIPAPRPIETNPILSPKISRIIERMLDKDMDKRYQNIDQVSDDIYSYFKSQSIEVPHKQISTFINDPQRISQNMIQEAKETYFKRGLYYLSRGKANLDDAIDAFTKVQYLDPADEQAKNHLATLRRKKKVAAPAKPKRVRIQKRNSMFKFAGIIGAILVIVVFAAALYRNYRNHEVPSTEYGYLSIDSKPTAAAVYLDDQELESNTPVVLDSIAAGEHVIEVRKRGYQPYRQNIEIKTGDTLSINSRLIREVATVATGKLAITSTPSGAKVIIDGTDTGLKTPCTVEKLSAGRHKIRLTKNGYQTKDITRTVQSDETTRVSLNLTRSQTPVARNNKRKSYFKINVDPWAKIYIDGKYIETTPIAKALQITAGTHTVRLTNPSFQTWQKKINFKSGETVSLDIKLQPFAGYLKLSVRPWADVYIDGRYYETTPIADAIQLPAGRHTIKLINPSFLTHEEVVTVAANKTMKKSVKLVPK
jgi:serine/threonine protein kinase